MTLFNLGSDCIFLEPSKDAGLNLIGFLNNLVCIGAI
jgi:hypothetical protein